MFRVLLLAGLATGFSNAGGTTLDVIRVHSIQPDVFPYRFMSVAVGGEAPRLAFNHVDGSTRFARVGERVGDYKLVAFVPPRDGSAVDTDGAALSASAGTAVLEDADGGRVELEQGILLPREGRVACLVSMQHGGWLYVSDGDALALPAGTVTVSLSEAGGVQVVSNGQTRPIPALTPDEGDRLEALWASHQREQAAAIARAREREAARREAEAERHAREEVERMLRAARPAPRAPPPAVSRPPRRDYVFFGTDYRFPVAFDTLPVTQRMPDGSLSIQIITVPTRFGTYRRGMGMVTR